jgi:hypothetical protein
MPRGVYERKKKGAQATARKGGGDSYADLIQRLRAEKTRAEDRVVALGTAIEALEAMDERGSSA